MFHSDAGVCLNEVSLTIGNYVDFVGTLVHGWDRFSKKLAENVDVLAETNCNFYPRFGVTRACASANSVMA
jgi:hypothetical protein